MKRFWSLIGTGLALFAMSCLLEPKGVQYDPPPIYRQWWVETERCSGLKGNFDRVTWFQEPGGTFLAPGGVEVYGFWTENHHIFIAETLKLNPSIVRHEMLHDLIGHPGHPSDLFIVKCAVMWPEDVP